MGCLVDTFIICLKDEWRTIASCPRKEDIFKLVNTVPKKYRIMFRKLIEEIRSLDQIIDTSKFEMGIEALLVASEYETEDVKFSDRHRGECLQQIIRKTFYDTLLIVENNFPSNKCNQFIVVNSGQVITEKQLEKNILGDQAFLHKAARTIDETGKIDCCLTIDGRKYSRGQNGELIVT